MTRDDKNQRHVGLYLCNITRLKKNNKHVLPTLARHATITLCATAFHTICFLDPLLHSPAHSAKIAPHKFRGSRCSETHVCEILLRCTHTINTKPNVLHELHRSHVTVSTRSFDFFFFFGRTLTRTSTCDHKVLFQSLSVQSQSSAQRLQNPNALTHTQTHCR